MAKDTFIFYKSFYDAISLLEDDESKIRVIEAVCDYVFNDSLEKSKELNKAEHIFFTMATPLIDANNRNYENGCKGGAPKGNQNARGHGAPIGNQSAKGYGAPKGNQNAKKQTNNLENKQTTNDNDNVKEKVNLNVNEEVNLKVNEKDKEEIDDLDNINISQSSIPLYADIKDFIAQQHLRVDAKLFFNYYQKRNWKNVKSWRKAILGWEDNLDEWDKTKEEADADEYAALWSK